MADWNHPNVCVLLAPRTMDTHPGWALRVQKLTEQGKLRRHYIRFGIAQKANVQAMMAQSGKTVRWKIVRSTPAYILVKVTFCPGQQPAPDSSPTRAA